VCGTSRRPGWREKSRRDAPGSTISPQAIPAPAQLPRPARCRRQQLARPAGKRPTDPFPIPAAIPGLPYSEDKSAVEEAEDEIVAEVQLEPRCRLAVSLPLRPPASTSPRRMDHGARCRGRFSYRRLAK
jgi:hypothetical protein